MKIEAKSWSETTYLYQSIQRPIYTASDLHLVIQLLRELRILRVPAAHNHLPVVCFAIAVSRV
jgi:hypothetical protein